MDVYDISQCVICQETNSESLSKVNAGVTTLIKFSKELNNDKLVKNLTSPRDNNGEVLIHSKCRKDYTNQQRLDNCFKITTERLPGNLRNNLPRRNNTSTVGLTPLKIQNIRIKKIFISQRPFHSEATS